MLGLKCLQNQGLDVRMNVLLFIPESPQHSARGCSEAEPALPPGPAFLFCFLSGGGQLPDLACRMNAPPGIFISGLMSLRVFMPVCR